MIPFADAKTAAGLFAAVAEPTRLRILHRLAHGPHHVGQLAELLDVPMANMSHHLGVMRSAGVLDHDKAGRKVVYCLRPGATDPPGPADLAVLCAGPYRLSIKRQPTPLPSAAPRKAARKGKAAS